MQLISDFVLNTLSKKYLKKLPLYNFQKTAVSLNGKNYEQIDRLINYGESTKRFDIFIRLNNAFDATDFPSSTPFKRYLKKLILDVCQENSFSFNVKMYKQIYRFIV